MSTREIAIIDDDREWVEVAARALTQRGYSVRAATSGEEGSELLTRAAPALAIIDVHLPGYNGLHLLSEFRRRNPTTPVLVISGEDRASVRHEALTNGANGFLQKPLPPALLLAAIRRLLDQSTAQVN